MLPLLRLVSDRQEHKYRDIIENLATAYQVTEEERKELLASGNQAVFDNRVGWAKTYLKKAGLLESLLKIRGSEYLLNSNRLKTAISGSQLNKLAAIKYKIAIKLIA